MWRARADSVDANASGVERNVFAPLPGSATDAPHHLRVAQKPTGEYCGSTAAIRARKGPPGGLSSG